jgi:hypothetical protein
MEKKHEFVATDAGNRTLNFFRAMLIGAFLTIANLASAGVTLTSPSVANGDYVNGVTFAANVTSDVAKVELSANGFAFGTLNAANN